MLTKLFGRTKEDLAGPDDDGSIRWAKKNMEPRLDGASDAVHACHRAHATLVERAGLNRPN